jgi:two-component system, LytTR family, sensor kinase
MQKNYPATLPRFTPVLMHCVAWFLYLALIIYVNNYQGLNFVAGHPGIHIFAQAIIFYFNYEYCIPSVLARKRPLKFLFLNVVAAIALVLVFIPGYHLLRNYYLGPGANPLPLSYPEQFTLRFFELLLFVVLACIIRFSVDWFQFQQRARDLENSQLKTELAFLRSQLNPHFLFNTLNALYALAIRQAPETSAGIMQLSQLMRYVLYEANDGRVDLSREVEMIENFLELQRLRLPLDFPLHFEVNGKTSDVLLEPLLLLPLIENIFKHGADFVRIILTVTDIELVLHTENGVNTTATQTNGGIGLVNLQKRLAYLYPGHHQLSCGFNDNIYIAILSITYKQNQYEDQVPGGR